MARAWTTTGTGCKIKLNDKRFERESTYDGSHIDLTSAKGGRDDAVSGMKEDALSFASTWALETWRLENNHRRSGKT